MITVKFENSRISEIVKDSIKKIDNNAISLYVNQDIDSLINELMNIAKSQKDVLESLRHSNDIEIDSVKYVVKKFYGGLYDIIDADVHNSYHHLTFNNLKEAEKFFVFNVEIRNSDEDGFLNIRLLYQKYIGQIKNLHYIKEIEPIFIVLEKKTD